MKHVTALAVSAIALLAASAASAGGVIYASPIGQNVNGVLTPNLTAVATPTVTLSADFNASSDGTGGVIIDELGQTTPNTGWHDSQIEMQANGHVLASQWYYGNVGTIDLGVAAFDTQNSVFVSYDDATGVLSGSLNGGALVSYTSYPGARQTPLDAGNDQYYAFGITDTTNLGNGEAFTGSISDVVITSTSVPEPASWALMILGVGLTGVALRRKVALPA